MILHIIDHEALAVLWAFQLHRHFWMLDQIGDRFIMLTLMDHQDFHFKSLEMQQTHIRVLFHRC